ncbi:DUF4440 domain-containing protein [Rathayibacter festucae]|uniref:DUF4440 domain-containing protein n=1 Tax=Rathayibacter festucae TaxID=110937 RepID=A0ABX6GZ93_9MICO|nr:nuclear transport factor 2 family protein [Rathayibacter festucae]QHC62748.1 DUF4440 domain-containing protein [Rathayibacter festucae]
MTTQDAATEDEIVALLHEQHAALVEGSTERLGAILADGFIAVHITGQKQTRDDWLAQVSSGRMRYHGIRETSAFVELAGDRARILSRAEVDATIWGSRAVWPLESQTDVVRSDGAWRIVRSRSTTY